MNLQLRLRCKKAPAVLREILYRILIKGSTRQNVHVDHSWSSDCAGFQTLSLFHFCERWNGFSEMAGSCAHHVQNTFLKSSFQHNLFLFLSLDSLRGISVLNLTSILRFFLLQPKDKEAGTKQNCTSKALVDKNMHILSQDYMLVMRTKAVVAYCVQIALAKVETIGISANLL